MPLKKETGAQSTPIDNRLEQVNARAEADSFKTLKQSTEIISFRVPIGERERLKRIFARHGLTLTEAVKRAVYDYACTIDRPSPK